jgi:hypothetical protein
LNVAGEILMGISTDERERAIFRSRRLYQSDEESNRITADYNAERRAKFEVARKLLTRNMPIDEIIDITGLSRSDLETLRQ